MESLSTSASDTGAATTLQIRVDGVLWSETPSLYEAGPDAEVYAVRSDADGTTRVVFGDGVHGKRLPTGALNIAAYYRSGMGLDGQVGEGALTLLKSRPLGVRSVTNPSPAKGAAAAESLWFIVYVFLSGAIAPLAVFPPIVADVVQWTPFPWMIWAPAELIAGRRPFDVGFGVAVTAAWAAV